jgi:hypothetical protein
MCKQGTRPVLDRVQPTAIGSPSDFFPLEGDGFGPRFGVGPFGRTPRSWHGSSMVFRKGRLLSRLLGMRSTSAIDHDYAVQHVSEAHLHRYLAEFDFRYSNRERLGINDVQRGVGREGR